MTSAAGPHLPLPREPGPPVASAFSSAVVMLSIVVGVALGVGGLVAGGREMGLFVFLAQGGAVTLAAIALLLGRACAVVERGQSAAGRACVQLWMLGVPPAALWVLTCLLWEQDVVAFSLLDEVATQAWAHRVGAALAPAHVSAVPGGVMVLPLLLVGVVGLTESVRRRRWAIGRRGAWLTALGLLGLGMLRWGFVGRLALRGFRGQTFPVTYETERMVALVSPVREASASAWVVAALLAAALVITAWVGRADGVEHDWAAALPMLVASALAAAMLIGLAVTPEVYWQRSRLPRLFEREAISLLPRLPHTLPTRTLALEGPPCSVGSARSSTCAGPPRRWASAWSGTRSSPR